MALTTKKKKRVHRKYIHLGYNKPELEAEYPDLANAFYYLLLKNKDQPKYKALYYNYLGRYLHHKTQTPRRVHLNHIIDTLKEEGMEVTLSVTFNGEKINPQAGYQFMNEKEVLIAHLGIEHTGLRNKKSPLFSYNVYLIGDHFWTICKQDQPPPQMKATDIQIEWQEDKGFFNQFGFRIYKCRAEAAHFFKPKQIIRY